MFKNSKRILTALALAMATILTTVVAQGGTSVQHFMFQTKLVNTGVDTNASGSVSGSIIRQGNADSQSLKISVAHLDPTTGYQLTALIGDDTNEVSVGGFTTSSKGAAAAA